MILSGERSQGVDSMHAGIPTVKQLEFLDWELGVFFHFGIRTFYDGHSDWDGVPMDAAAFCPSELDCGQWIRVAAAGGARYAVMTAKHHDGFALWPSRFTDYSVKNTPWQNGRGDVVREFTDACRRYGLKVGLYYSPAQFGSSDVAPSDYDEYFIAQISELLTAYGKIDYLWFDGCGCEGHSFDTERIVKTIRELQPDILLFNLWDPDTRWVGNEDGVAPADIRYVKDGSFLPYECDCKIRPGNWFWTSGDAGTLRTPEEIMGLYELSVGRGGNLLLNIGPDRRGLLPDRDARSFIRFGENLRKKYSRPLDVRVAPTADGALQIDAWPPVSVDTLVLEEDLTRGQLIDRFTVKYCCPDGALLSEGYGVGHKRIVRFPTVKLGYGPSLLIETSGDADRALRSVKAF